MNFFDDWTGVARVLVIGALAYVSLVVVLRVSGKRTLAKMNAFDLVVTVAFGSTLSSAILDSGVPLVESIVAFALLAALQAAVAFGAVRSDRLQELIKSEPRLLVRDGRMLHDAMRAERVSREEILQAMRNSGISELAEVEALVLETDGGFSILERVGDDGRSPLADVRGPDTG